MLLKDPLCGSMGVIALITVILLKAAALAAVIQQQQLLWLWAVPLLARLSLLFLFLSTRYVRPQGLGEVLAQHFSRAWALRVLASAVAAHSSANARSSPSRDAGSEWRVSPTET